MLYTGRHCRPITSWSSDAFLLVGLLVQWRALVKSCFWCPYLCQCQNLAWRFLNRFTHVASTTSCGNRFRSFTTRWLKKNFRTSRLARCFDSFTLWPLELYSHDNSWKKCSRSTASFPVIILYVSIRLLPAPLQLSHHNNILAWKTTTSANVRFLWFLDASAHSWHRESISRYSQQQQQQKPQPTHHSQTTVTDVWIMRSQTRWTARVLYPPRMSSPLLVIVPPMCRHNPFGDNP